MNVSAQRPFSHSLLFNLLLVVGGVVVMNGLIFSLEWSTSSPEKLVDSPSFTPPGWVVGAAWTLWFIGLAVARWSVARLHSKKGSTVRSCIDVLIVSCLLYPLYSLAIGSVVGGLIGNVFTVLLATFVFFKAYPVSKKASWFLFPIIPWVLFATVITLAEMGWL